MPAFARKTAAALIVSLTFGSAACSSPESDSGADGASAGDGGLAPQGWPFQARPVDEAARTAAMEAIGARCDELAKIGQDRATQNQAMADFVRTAPEVAIAAPSEDGVVAYFYDQQAIIILNNTVTASEVASRSNSIPPQPAPSESSSSQHAFGGYAPFALEAGRDLPWGKQAVLLNAFPENADSMLYPPNPLPELASALSNKGYVATSTLKGSVAGFTAVGGDGVVHIRTHGGGGCFDNRGGACKPSWDPNEEIDPTDRNFWPQVLYGLWTTDVDDEPNRAAHQEDLKDGSLVHMYETSGVWSKDWHLGITGKFIAKRWKGLSMNSYVHVSACSSAGKEAQSQLVTALKAKGASVYVGWSRPAVISTMDQVAKFMFDRLLGANQIDPRPDPPQRPFDYVSIIDDLSRNNLTASGNSTLTPLLGGGGGMGLLAPSIETLEPFDTDDSLIIHGVFGNDKSVVKVTVGGADCPVLDSSSTTIRCKLDQAAKGDVVVTVRDHESNKVKLTSWRGKLTYETVSNLVGLSQTWTFELHLRGDVGDYRDKSGGELVAHEKVVSASKASKVTVSAGGSVSGACNVTWTQPATITVPMWGTPATGTDGYFATVSGVVDEGDPNHFWFEVAGWAKPCYTLSATGDCSTLATDIACGMPQPAIMSPNAAHPFQDILAGRLIDPAGFSAGGIIEAKNIAPVDAVCCGGEFNVPWSYTQRAEWEQMSPETATGPSRSHDAR